jgi:hypothetical protein
MKADLISATARAESPVKSALWLALLTTASILATLAMACATPFAALGALAALHLRRSQAFILTGAVWLASQVVGFGFLNYPHTLTTYAWGGALLVAAWASMAGSATITRHLRRAGGVLRSVCTLFAAMVIFKGAIYGFGLALGGNHGAFTPPVVARFCATNLIAFVGLMALYRLGVAIGLAARPTPFITSVAH